MKILRSISVMTVDNVTGNKEPYKLMAFVTPVLDVDNTLFTFPTSMPMDAADIDILILSSTVKHFVESDYAGTELLSGTTTPKYIKARAFVCQSMGSGGLGGVEYRTDGVGKIKPIPSANGTWVSFPQSTYTNLKFLKIDESLDLSALIALDGMFMASGIESLVLRNQNATNMQTIRNFVNNNTIIKYVDLSNWYTPIVSNMNGFANGATSLEVLDLSGWDLSHVYDWGNAFTGTALKHVKIGNLDATDPYVIGDLTGISNVAVYVPDVQYDTYRNHTTYRNYGCTIRRWSEWDTAINTYLAANPTLKIDLNDFIMKHSTLQV